MAKLKFSVLVRILDRPSCIEEFKNSKHVFFKFVIFKFVVSCSAVRPLPVSVSSHAFFLSTY